MGKCVCACVRKHSHATEPVHENVHSRLRTQMGTTYTQAHIHTVVHSHMYTCTDVPMHTDKCAHTTQAHTSAFLVRVYTESAYRHSCTHMRSQMRSVNEHALTNVLTYLLTHVMEHTHICSKAH